MGKSGGVGQEVYEVGISFGVVPRQYSKVSDDIPVFVDYPVANYRKSKSSFTFDLLGAPNFRVRFKS